MGPVVERRAGDAVGARHAGRLPAAARAGGRGESAWSGGPAAPSVAGGRRRPGRRRLPGGPWRPTMGRLPPLSGRQLTTRDAQDDFAEALSTAQLVGARGASGPRPAAAVAAEVTVTNEPSMRRGRHRPFSAAASFPRARGAGRFTRRCDDGSVACAHGRHRPAPEPSPLPHLGPLPLQRQRHHRWGRAFLAQRRRRHVLGAGRDRHAACGQPGGADAPGPAGGRAACWPLRASRRSTRGPRRSGSSPAAPGTAAAAGRDGFGSHVPHQSIVDPDRGAP
jgi:hypothetical protein